MVSVSRKRGAMRLIGSVGVGALLSSIMMSSSAFAAEPDGAEKLVTRSDAVGLHIQKSLSAKFRKVTKRMKQRRGALVEYYTEADFKPLWINQTGLNEKALAVLAEIEKADSWGLKAADYKLADLRALNNAKDNPTLSALKTGSALNINTNNSAISLHLAKLELKMSNIALDYARHASGGRIVPRSLSRNMDYDPPYADPQMVMTKFAASDNVAEFMHSLHPKHEQFVRLKAQLKKLRGPQAAEKKIVRIPNGPSLRPGMSHKQIALLRQRLNVPFDPSSAPKQDDAQDVAADAPKTKKGTKKAASKITDPALRYDEALAEAVRKFQKSKGLKAEGVVGPLTRKALNRRPRKANTSLILANMERWRWMPKELGQRYATVNVPEFKVRVVNKGKIIHEERTVVGKIKHKTPAFSDKMEFIVFNPYWYPPRSIIRNEIIPGAQRSSAFLNRHGLQVTNASGRRVDGTDIDWYSNTNRLFFRQPPGKGNVLGVVKFLFPNRHAVYMHDTPVKNLFNTTVRTYSHGCLRIRDPLKLAEVIMTTEPGWNRTRINRAVRSGANQRVTLKNKLDVHITYLTAKVDDNGKLHVYRDVYGYDRRVIAAVNGKRLPKEVFASNKPKPKPRRKRASNGFLSFFDNF